MDKKPTVTYDMEASNIMSSFNLTHDIACQIDLWISIIRINDIQNLGD